VYAIVRALHVCRHLFLYSKSARCMLCLWSLCLIFLLLLWMRAAREVRGWGGGHALGGEVGERATATTSRELRWREILAFKNRGIPVALVRAT
jgi:hypothetical protein